MKILSLFDGMSCGHIAFDSLGIPIDRYVAYEIDKYATKTATHNFPDIEQCGDVFEADFTIYRDFDWQIGGSPCTFWSIARTTNRETTASGLGWELFSQYVRALHEAKPKFFLYENNKSMSPAIRAQISETFGFEPICINSALVGAQTRQRLYWVGYRNEDGTYSQVHIEQPGDRGILLRDILETTTGEKGYALAEPVNITSEGKAQCLRATYYKDGIRNMVGNNVDRKTCVAEPVRIGTIENAAKNQDHDSQQYRVYSPDAKTVTLCGCGGGVGAKTGLYAIPINQTTDGKAQTLKAQYGKNSIANFCCYTSTYGATGVAVCVNIGGTPTEMWIEGANGNRIPVYEAHNGKIIVKGKEYPIKLRDGCYIIRKLTVTECKRLQTVPDTYEFPVSDTQAYKMLGNGWTVEVIKHLIQSTYNFAKEELI